MAGDTQNGHGRGKAPIETDPLETSKYANESLYLAIKPLVTVLLYTNIINNMGCLILLAQVVESVFSMNSMLYICICGQRHDHFQGIGADCS
jgi:hypothetical protein